MELQSTVDLKKFIQLSKIGSGSFGEVYKVKEKKNGEIFAAKISFKELEENSVDILRDLSREVNILSKINHPSILRFIGFSSINFRNQPKPIIITEYLANGSLYDVIESERKSLSRDFWNDTRKLINLYGIASAMSFLHKNNIIHRDLKPGNILMDDFLFPKIADFGLSKIKHKNNESMTVGSTLSIKGTPAYMAPEVWEITTDYTTACDVYSFAIIAYEILTGLEPFKGLDCFALHSKITSGFRPKIPEFLPDSYKQLIENCWQQNPQDRPTFDEIVESLKTDEGFITDLIEENDYLDYVDYIDNYKTSFDSKSRIINVDEYIKRKKIQNATFKKISISGKNKTGNEKVDENISSTKKSVRSSIFKKKEKKGSSIYPTVEYNELDPDCQMMVQTAEKDSNKQFEIAVNLIEGKSGFPQNTEIGIKYIEQSIKDDNINAIIYYCRMLIDGEIITQDIPKAKKMLKKIMKEGSPTIFLLFGLIHKKEEDYVNARKFFNIAANSGNAEAMYEIGKMYYKGVLSQKNEKEALKYFKLSKKNRYEKSDKYLAILDKDFNKSESQESKTQKGEVPSDKKEAAQYYKKYADNGDVESMIKYSKILKNGIGVPADFKGSIKYLKMAADNKDVESMFNYGLILFQGDGVPEDKKKASSYFKDAANNKHVEAMFLYGTMLLTGEGAKQNKSKASKYFKGAADKGNSKAMLNYAIMLNKGDGIESNKEEAINYFKKAINAGNKEAMYKYGLILFDGDGVEKDRKTASHYFKLAADKGHVKSIFKYATMLYSGEDILEDKNSASFYFKMGADKGDKQSLFQFVAILSKNEGIKLESKNAAQYYKKAADMGDNESMYRYGLLLLSGDGVQTDKKKAAHYFKKATDAGHFPSARNYLLMLKTKDGIKKDLEEIARVSEILSYGGDANDLYNYGLNLYHGNNMKQDKPKAMKIFKKAADAGNVYAMKKYAALIDNLQESFKYFKMAADKDDTQSMLIVFQKYKIGEGTPVNGEEALKYLKKALQRKDADENAFLAYGIILASGECGNLKIEKNEKEGVKNIKIAADMGSVLSMRLYAGMNFSGEGIEINKKEAAKYFKMAADKGDDESITFYAKMLYNGDGIEKNMKEALKYIKIASDNGNKELMILYAKLLLNGEEVTQNFEEAAKTVKRLADEYNDDQSMLYYGLMLLNGRGVPKDIKEGYRYLKMAADNGNVEAMGRYGSLITSGDDFPQDFKEGAKYLKKAAENNDPLGMCDYAMLLYIGLEVEKNVSEALRYCKKSMEMGCQKAKNLYDKELNKYDH